MSLCHRSQSPSDLTQPSLWNSHRTRKNYRLSAICRKLPVPQLDGWMDSPIQNHENNGSLNHKKKKKKKPCCLRSLTIRSWQCGREKCSGSLQGRKTSAPLQDCVLLSSGHKPYCCLLGWATLRDWGGWHWKLNSLQIQRGFQFGKLPLQEKTGQHRKGRPRSTPRLGHWSLVFFNSKISVKHNHSTTLWLKKEKCAKGWVGSGGRCFTPGNY